MLSRRDFLRNSSLVALAPAVPAFLAHAARAAKPDRDGRVLVVVELDGGNDGINTVVPFNDPGYAKSRKTLRLRREQLVRVNDEVGLHPAMDAAGKLLEAGRLCVVQGVGYPNPNRSHFESMAIWQTARLKPGDDPDRGWLGRALDARGGLKAEPAAFLGGNRFPVALRGERAPMEFSTRAEDYVLQLGDGPRRAAAGPAPEDDLTAYVQRTMLGAYGTAGRMNAVLRASVKDEAKYPGGSLGGQLRLAARMLKADVGVRIFYARQSGYDTHIGQLYGHSNLLGDLANSVKAFLDDMAAAKLLERVTVLVFSEFGRTVLENASAGTDHGTAGPVFLAGGGVKAGAVGQAPRLLDLVDGEPKAGLDFRRVYATVLEDWLGLPAKPALAGQFERLPLFR